MPLTTFKDRYPGTVRRLSQARLNGRVFHSWIFTGDNASELHRFVYSWLQICICEKPTKDGDACGHCDFCQRFEKKIYPYLFEIKPTSKSRRILVDEIRDLEHFLYLTTAGELKLGLIVDADCMSIQAQNAFLKTLEEPVANVILILTTQNVEGLLPTIRSRCQTVALRSNQYEYRFNGSIDLFKVLATMKKGAGAMAADSGSEQIKAILEKLKKEAESLSKKGRNRRGRDHDIQNKDAKKKQESIVQAQIASQYISLRTQVISAIHAWYGQEFLRSSGIPIDSLPHPDFYSDLANNVKNEIPNSNDALHALQISDNLIENFVLNVSEQLAVQEFCHRICIKGE